MFDTWAIIFNFHDTMCEELIKSITKVTNLCTYILIVSLFDILVCEYKENQWSSYQCKNSEWI